MIQTTTIGPFSKPVAFDSVLRQAFAVDQETPRDIAAMLAQLAAVERAPERPDDDGPLLRRLRRLRYF